MTEPIDHPRNSSIDPISHKIRPKHGEAKKSKEYEAWCKIKRRCSGKSKRSMLYYAGRGITVCARWKESFVNFLQDVGRAPSSKHSLDRIDNNGNYEPGNVRWATSTQQANNKRNNRFLEYNGEVKTIATWCHELGINRGALVSRLKRKWSVARSFETPIKK